MEKKYIIGYTTGVFDLFHVGHLNILRESKKYCDYLIVGVTTDEITKTMKGKHPVIPFEERIQIVENIKCVDLVKAKDKLSTSIAWKKNKFNLMFKGDDWKNTLKGQQLENELNPLGIEVIYLPYTKHTSSTILKVVLAKLLNK